MGNSASNPFTVAIAAAATTAVNKPGDACPPLAQLVDPFEGATWTMQGTTILRNGIATKPRLDGATRVYINLESVWCTSPHGYSYWNRTTDEWLFDAGHGKDGNFF